MTVRVLAVPTVEPEHRWLISKWRAFNGFYECTSASSRRRRCR